MTMTANEQIEYISRRLDHYKIREFFEELERQEREAEAKSQKGAKTLV